MRNSLVIALLLVALAGVAFAGKFTDVQTGNPKKDDAKADGKDSAAKIPALKAPVMFDTPEADLLMSRINLVPKDSPWVWDVSKCPVAKNSKPMIAAITSTGCFRACFDMGFVIVPPDQPKVAVKIVNYPRESDPGPYPVPDTMPIQGWPMSVKDLATIQKEGTGDRHAFVLDPYNGRLYEFYDTRKTAAGWQASNAAVFDLTSNRLRPKGWTSADAAGLPILPGTIRFDEVERGIVAHALRVTVKDTRQAYIYPARHFASTKTSPDLPAMGERMRLRADFDISKFPRHVQAVLLGMKKYGLIVADNGDNWDLCFTPDRRIQGMQALRNVHGSDIEVVDVSALVAEASAKNP